MSDHSAKIVTARRIPTPVPRKPDKEMQAAAFVLRRWFEEEKVFGCMSLNARQNFEKCLSDMEAGGR